MESFTIEQIVLRYNKHIYDRYKSLIDSGKTIDQINNNDLAKIFEYYSCIKLMIEYKQKFYEYDDINPEFKELNKMSRTDTGIDACNLTDTIVQCKLRMSNTNLNWKECGTFFASQNIFNEETNETIVRWKKLIITRNSDCNLSKHFDSRKQLFLDKEYNKTDMITYCNKLVSNPPILILNYTEIVEDKKELRDYQIECKNLIIESKSNVIISLPTGTGKNLIIINSLKEKTKYLILVPYIILMEQIKDEIKKQFPKLARSIQCIGGGENVYDDKKNICICVYNSIDIVKEYAETFEKIFIDEAHHIKTPEIYVNEEDNIDSCDDNNLEDDDEEDDLENDEDDEELDNEEEIDSEDDEEIKEIEQVEEKDNENDNISKTFIAEIASLSKYNNNVYLSATIDKQEGFVYYYKDIREMIKKGYLCDYTIHIPIFSEDPTNKSVCEYLIKNYRNIIIYCNSQKEGNTINKLMNSIQKGCSQYVDCKTSKITRKKIIDKYKSGDIPFLVNVRILVEGFDAPITKGVVFMHLPSNGKTIIQIIGRCLRLHEGKNIANVILPFSSKGDEDSINNFLKVMAKNDSRLRNSYEEKKLGGYISISKVDKQDNIDDDEKEDDEEDIKDNEDNEIELKFNMIFDSMGKIKNREQLWLIRFEDVKKYIDENGKRPYRHIKHNKNKILGLWIDRQTYNYKKKTCIMLNQIIYNIFKEFITCEQYKIYFQPNVGTYEEKWINKLEEVKKYININNKRPSQLNKNIEIRILSRWITTQFNNYNNKKYLMKNNIIYNKWTNFINDEKYKLYLQTNEEIWINKLEEIKKYIDKNNKRPSSSETKDKSISNLGQWLLSQTRSYKNKNNIMKNKIIYDIWTNFINDDKYKIYFQSNEEIWIDILKQVIIYIDKNNKRPSSENEDKEISKLGKWLLTQTKNYKKKLEIMSNEIIYNNWTNFINDNKYQQYLEKRDDKWLNMFIQLTNYIDINNKIPSYKNNKILYKWLSHQKLNYKNKTDIMQNENNYNKWTKLINNTKYKQYFESYEDKWFIIFNKVKIYIDINNKRPSQVNKNNEIKYLGSWIGGQINNYKKQIDSMTNPKIYKQWSGFINDDKYKQHFQ